MPAIKVISTGAIIAVAVAPVWVNGIWECCDQRFQDQDGTHYAPVTELPLLTPMTLYLAFTPAERIAIKASTDAMVKEFWATYQLSAQLEKPTDPNLVSVQSMLAYLAAPVSPGPGAGILASQARIAQILAGIPQ
jgi:hypothetical protein